MSNYTPIFPYQGAQILITSDRIVIHTEEDAIFLFGKKAVGLSSPGRVHIDTKEGVTVNAPEIELGLQAKEIGEPVVKGLAMEDLLRTLLTRVEKVSAALQNPSPEGVPALVQSAKVLEKTCQLIRSNLEFIKSKTTFTR